MLLFLTSGMDYIKLRVTGIVHETRDSVTLFFEPIGFKKIIYHSGQFITFIFKRRDGTEIRRSYSFSSSPPADPFYSITVKRTPNGEVSRYLTDKLIVHETLTAILPAGRFTITTSPDSSRQIFFLAAGSGIVPIYSLIKNILLEEPRTSILLIYQNHDEDNIIFENQLRGIEKKYDGQFRWLSLLSKPRHKPATPQKLNNVLLEKIIREQTIIGREQLFYLCGPGSFMRMAQFTLKWMGVSEDSIRKENFTIDFVPPAPVIADTSDKNIIIHVSGRTTEIKAGYRDNILQAALNHHIQLPYSCRAGRCSSCVARCLQGKVMITINEVLTEKDLESGLVLTCVGYALTDCELAF
jgi:ring-1,2-phenylacetyl-CoA epoxidase subunit PaaE